jgi:hypothetical protein
VVDATGRPLGAAEVTVSDTARKAVGRVRTSSDGFYVIRGLPPSRYQISVRAIGFRPAVARDVRVLLGQITVIGDIGLETAAVELEPVVVHPSVVAMDPASTDHASRLDMRSVEKLPVGRDYASAALLLPQVTESYFHRDGVNISGSTGLETAYYIDGINVTEPFRNGGGIALPSNFVDHFEVKTGSYGAEAGRATGGIITAVTRRGSSAHRASGFSQFTASGLASTAVRGPLELESGGFARYDAGFSMEGPVQRDITYFAAFDRSITSEKLRLPGGAQHEDRENTDHFAGKLDWRASDKTGVSLTVLGDPTTRQLVGNAFWSVLPIRSLRNPEPFLGFWNTGGAAVAMNLNHRLADAWTLQANVSRAQFRDETGPKTPLAAPLFVDFTKAEWSGGYGNSWHRKSVRSAATTSIAYDRRRYNARLGVELEENAANENWVWIPGRANGDGVTFYNGSVYIALPLSLQTRARTRIPSIYLSQSALLHPKLRLNVGLRDDAQYFFSPTTGRSGSITDQYQPRLGAIFYPTGDEKQKVTGFVGRFYEQLPLLPITWMYGGLEQTVRLYGQDPAVDPTPFLQFGWKDVPGPKLRGQHYDEYSLAYEANIDRDFTVSIRRTHRRLREIVIETTADSAGRFMPGPAPFHVLGNPGRAEWSAMPRPDSRYDALELQLSREGARSLIRASYTISRKRGNYAGVLDIDGGNPNAQVAWRVPGDSADVTKTNGPLPNDRPEVLKLLGSLRVTNAFTVGSAASWQSGLPRTQQGFSGADPSTNYLIGWRGGLGRTPSLWDIGLRGSYEFAGIGRTGTSSRAYLDVLHLFSPRRAVRIDDVSHLDVDAAKQPITPNPLFGQGIQFQPPMTVRLGVEIGSGGRP